MESTEIVKINTNLNNSSNNILQQYNTQKGISDHMILMLTS